MADRSLSQLHAERQLRKDLWISALALVSVGIGLYDLARPRPDIQWRWYDFIDLFIVLIFIVDFARSARLSGDARRYTRQHWYEVPALLPLTPLLAFGLSYVPLLRGLRLVRLLRVFRLLRVVGTLGRLEEFWRRTLRIARRAHLARLLVFALFVVAIGAALMWLFEAPHNESVERPPDAIWWALNMFTNVVYVDFQPATAAGRFIAASLAILGIGFIGLFTASLASAIVLEGRDEEPPLDTAPLD